MVGSSGVWRDLRDVTMVWDGEDVDEEVKYIDMEWRYVEIQVRGVWSGWKSNAPPS